MAPLLSSWTVVALAGAAWAYQPLARVGPHGVTHGRMLRPRPVRCSGWDDDLELLDDDELSESAIGDESELLFDDELSAAAVAAATVARSAEAVAAVRASATAAAEALKADLAAGAFSAPSAKPKEMLYKALRKPERCVALLGEGSPQLKVSLGGYDLNDPKFLSQQFRVGGCSAICVRVGGEHELSPNAIAVTAKEQALAKGDFPGPLPILARLDVVDEVQLAKVAADGACAATLSLHLNGQERTKELMEAANGYGLETVIKIANSDELATALELGAKMVCLSDCSLAQAHAMLPAVPAEVWSICDVRVRDVRGAWKVRDLGFNALIVSDAVLEVCARDRVPPDAVIRAMISKGSVEFGLGMQKGRLEGAKESLGSLAM